MLESNELVSICIPVYNGSQYIGETINSLLRQTYNNVEIIVSDNASTDNTIDIVKKISLIDSRIICLESIRNEGFSTNVRKCVNAANSEIICIYHADDIYSPKIIERQLAVLNSVEQPAAVFVKPRILESNKIIVTKPNVYDNFMHGDGFREDENVFVGGLESYIPIILEYGNIFVCPSLMTKKKIFLSLGGYKDDYPSNEDLALWIEYLSHAYKLAILDEYLIDYRKSKIHASYLWSKKIECPIEYIVIEEKLFPIIGQVREELLQSYKRRKSIALLNKAFLALSTFKIKRSIKMLSYSKITYKFRIKEKWFYIQNNLLFGYLLSKIVLPILKKIKKLLGLYR
jgi:glycosyltransferase involved in cell wall biosynthesis